MVTIGDAMVTLLIDNWAGAAPTPTFGHLVDFPADLPPSQEQVMVRLPIHEDVTPINDTYSNFKYTIQIRVKSNVSDDRLKVLADETIRIINTYAITGITRQFAKRGENTSDRKKRVFAYDVWATCEEHMSTAGTSYSSPGAGDVTFPNDVTITRDLAVGRDLAVTRNTTVGGTLGVTGDATVANLITAGTVDGVDVSTHKASLADHTDLTATAAQLEDLLMFGSANAAWVPCPLESFDAAAFRIDGNGVLSNIDGTNGAAVYAIPLQYRRGTLRLKAIGTRISLSDADATNYVDSTYLFGYSSTAKATLDTDATNKNSIALHTDTFSEIDLGSYSASKVRLSCVVADADALDIQYVLVNCYYT